MKFMKIALGASLAACVTAPVLAQSEEAQGRAEQRMKVMDRDKDGTITIEEFTEFRSKWTSKRPDGDKLMKPQSIKRAYAKIDSDDNGAISFEEILADTAKMKKYR